MSEVSKKELGKILSGSQTSGAKLWDKAKEVLGIEEDKEAEEKKIREKKLELRKKSESLARAELPTERM